MKLLSRQAQRSIEGWISRNARPLELAQYNILFHGAPVQPFLSLLACYQNADGGFGHALEPDNWNPASTPLTTSTAIQRLRLVGFLDYSHSLYRQALDYLAGCEHRLEEGWPFTIPSNNGFPRAPWWTYSEEGNRKESFGLSCVLASFVLDAGAPGRPVYESALRIARQALDRLRQDLPCEGEMGIAGLVAFCPQWERLGWAPQSETLPNVKARVDHAICRDPERWGGYVPRPSVAISGPDSAFYPGNEAIVETELDYLIDTLPEDGVWPLTWRWFDMPYPDEWAVAQNWWKAVAAMEKLLFLRAFGRME